MRIHPSSQQMVNSERVLRVIACVMLTGSLLFFTSNIITRSSFYNSYFIPDWQDTYMDYFNMLENVRLGDPYYANANYPAMCFLLLKILFHMVPQGSLEPGLTARHEAMGLRELAPAIMPFLLVTVFCVVVICFITRGFLRKMSLGTQNLVVLAVVFSGPMLFLLERGNLLLWSFTLTLVFLFLCQSDKKWHKVLACLSLALAASIKIYPAIFAVGYLKEKHFREFCLFALSFSAFMVLPFFVFSGFDSIKMMLEGLFLSSGESIVRGFGYNYSASNLFGVIDSAFNVGIPSFIPMAVSFAACAVLYFKANERWQEVAALSLACIWIPSFSYTYTLVFLIPILLVVASENKKMNILEALSLLFIAFALIPLPLPGVPFIAGNMESYYVMSWGHLINNIAIVLFAVVAFMSARFESLQIRFGINND